MQRVSFTGAYWMSEWASNFERRKGGGDEEKEKEMEQGREKRQIGEKIINR